MAASCVVEAGPSRLRKTAARDDPMRRPSPSGAPRTRAGSSHRAATPRAGYTRVGGSRPSASFGQMKTDGTNSSPRPPSASPSSPSAVHPSSSIAPSRQLTLECRPSSAADHPRAASCPARCTMSRSSTARSAGQSGASSSSQATASTSATWSAAFWPSRMSRIRGDAPPRRRNASSASRRTRSAGVRRTSASCSSMVADRPAGTRVRKSTPQCGAWSARTTSRLIARARGRYLASHGRSGARSVGSETRRTA